MSTQKITRRDFLKFAGLATAGATLAACAPAVTPTAAPAPTEAPAATAVPAATAAPAMATDTPAAIATGAPTVAKTITINHWSWLTASDGDVWQKMINAFNDANKNKGLQINFTGAMDQQVYNTKVLAGVAAGQAPDFGWNTGGMQLNWIKQGALVSMDDLATKVGLDLTDFSDGSMKQSRYPSQGNKLYLVPMDAMCLAMEINTDHAKAAGLDLNNPPQTGDDMIKWAQAMTQSSGGKVTRSGFIMTGTGLHPAAVWGIVAKQMGFKRTSDDFKTSCINPDKGAAAIQWELDLFDKYKVSSRDVTDRYKAFSSGQGSIFWTGPWTISGNLAAGLNFMTVPIPKVGDTNETYYELGGLEMYTQQDTGRYEATMEVIKWLSDNSFLWTTVGRGASPRKSISSRSDYKTAGSPWAVRGAFIDSLPNATIGALPIVESGELTIYNGGTFLNDDIDAAINNKKTPAQAMTDLKAKWDTFLAEG